MYSKLVVKKISISQIEWFVCICSYKEIIIIYLFVIYF
jgi:hypothetical protein